MTFWISKTHVRIEPSEMTRAEALQMARELMAELDIPINLNHSRWTPEMDEKLRVMRSQRKPIRQIAQDLFGSVEYVGKVSGRIRRLGLPVDAVARRRGLASQAARRAAE
jgi:hypothetical protein